MSTIKKSQIIIVFLIIIVLFLLIFFGFNYYNGFNNASINDLKITYGVNGNSNSISNELPLSDVIGKNYTYDKDSKFVAYNTIRISSLVDYPVKYELYLIKKNNGATINEKYVKFYLCDDELNALSGYEKNSVPSFGSLNNSNFDSSQKVLFRGVLNPKETDNIIIKSWLSEVYSLDKNKKDFSYEINVRII